MFVRQSIIAAFGMALAVPATAQQSASSTGTAAVEITEPSALLALKDLDFADILVTAPGTAVINPNTDAMTTSPGLAHAAGTPSAARFQITPTKRGSIFITIPQAPITLTRVSGTETVTVSNWTISSNAQLVGGGRHKVVAGSEPLFFQVGGTLNVGANPKMGVYMGTFEVTLENQ